MKTTQLIAASLLILASASDAAEGSHNHSHEHKPLHGGVVVEVKDMDYELVAKPTAIQLYLRDHGKAVDIAKASAKITLLTGTEKQEAALKPAGDKLEAVGTFKLAPGTKAVAVLMIGGKPSTARFTLK